MAISPQKEVHTYYIDTPLNRSNVKFILKDVTSSIEQHQSMVLDLSKLTMIDSSGIAMLITLKNLAVKKNCHFVINNTPDIVSRMCVLYKINL